MSINQWPPTERPRERLMSQGAQSLSNAELLAIFLRTGTQGKSAIDLARELLNHFGSLDKVLDANLKSFIQIKGLGSAKFCQLQASLEIARRHFECKVSEEMLFNDVELTRNYLLANFPKTPNEIFACIFLTNANKLIKFKTLFSGTINQAPIYPRIVAQSCLKYNAAALICVHNHPSGNIKASQSDIHMTQQLIKTLKLIDVRLLDHFIIGENDLYSMAQNGLI